MFWNKESGISGTYEPCFVGEIIASSVKTCTTVNQCQAKCGAIQVIHILSLIFSNRNVWYHHLPSYPKLKWFSTCPSYLVPISSQSLNPTLFLLPQYSVICLLRWLHSNFHYFQSPHGSLGQLRQLLNLNHPFCLWPCCVPNRSLIISFTSSDSSKASCGSWDKAPSLLRGLQGPSCWGPLWTSKPHLPPSSSPLPVLCFSQMEQLPATR